MWNPQSTIQYRKINTQIPLAKTKHPSKCAPQVRGKDWCMTGREVGQDWFYFIGLTTLTHSLYHTPKECCMSPRLHFSSVEQTTSSGEFHVPFYLRTPGKKQSKSCFKVWEIQSQMGWLAAVQCAAMATVVPLAGKQDEDLFFFIQYESTTRSS